MAASTMESRKTYLSFILDSELFAVDVAQVREVLDYTSVTRVPRTPEYMKGVINLRGGVVPVVDMRLKFGLPRCEESIDTCIIVLEVDFDGEETMIGAMADSVQAVFELTPEEIEPPPRLGALLDSSFIEGMGRHNDDFIIILDVDRIFSAEELEIIGRGSNSEDLPRDDKGASS